MLSKLIMYLHTIPITSMHSFLESSIAINVQFKWLLSRFNLEANLYKHWWQSIISVQTNHQLLFCLKMNFLMIIKSLIICVCIKKMFWRDQTNLFAFLTNIFSLTLFHVHQKLIKTAAHKEIHSFYIICAYNTAEKK